MDKLDSLISEKLAQKKVLEAKLSGVQKELTVLDAEVEALQTAAELRPANGRTKTKGSGKKGRQPGAISEEWRNVLAEVVLHYDVNNRASYNDIHAVAELLNLNIALNSVRDRVRNMVKTGLLAGTPDDGFYVTEAAVNKFDFETEKAPAEAEANSEIGVSGGPQSAASYPAPAGSIPAHSTVSSPIPPWRKFDDDGKLS